MIRISKILIPTDFSDASNRAVNYGLSLALEFKARIVLAHAERVIRSARVPVLSIPVATAGRFIQVSPAA